MMMLTIFSFSCQVKWQNPISDVICRVWWALDRWYLIGLVSYDCFLLASHTSTFTFNCLVFVVRAQPWPLTSLCIRIYILPGLKNRHWFVAGHMSACTKGSKDLQFSFLTFWKNSNNVTRSVGLNEGKFSLLQNIWWMAHTVVWISDERQIMARHEWVAGF